MLLLNGLIVLFLILLNGFFSMSELAVVSARRARLQQMQQSGRRGAARALKLLEDPTGFMSTVQVGITLVGIIAGAYGGSAFAAPLATVLEAIPGFGDYAETVAFGIVVVIITYLSLIFGELVPKRYALRHAEGIAVTVAPFMAGLATVGAPIVWLLRVSTLAVARLIGVRSEDSSSVTEEDVKAMIAEGTQSGVFEPKEREMLEGVLRIADRNVRSIMIPRPDAAWLASTDSPEEILEEIQNAGHSRYPLIGIENDDVIGVVQAKDLLDQLRQSGTIDLAKAVREPLFVNETMPILKLLDRFRTANLHMAIVLDEYGSFEGIVTPMDILVGIAGSLPEGIEDDYRAVQRVDGSWLLDGGMPIDDVERAVAGLDLPRERDYETLAGFVLEQFGHIPEIGERFDHAGWVFEVVDLDGRRIDKLLLSRPRSGSDEGEDTAS